MRRSVLFFVVLLTCFVIPSAVSAETVLRIGSDISVASDQIIEGNYYVSAYFGKTTMSGLVQNDMIAIGGTVTMNGTVNEDLHILGGGVQVHGIVEDDVRIVGGEVTIGGEVKGDVVVIGGSLSILPSANIGGDVFFFGGMAEINGAIAGSVFGSAEVMSINASIARSVDVRAVQSLTLGERAVVEGDIRYTSQRPIERNTNAVVNGSVVQNTMAEVTTRDTLQTALAPFLVLLFTTLSLYLLFKNEITIVMSHISRSLPVSGFIGLGVLVIGPILSMILIATVLGSIIGIMSLFLIFLLIIASGALASIYVGTILSQLIIKKQEVSLLWILAGSFTLYSLIFIPVIGLLLYVTIGVLTLGGITISLYKSLS